MEKEKPSKPGYYWFKNSLNNRWMMTRVYRYPGEELEAVLVADSENHGRKIATMEGDWRGPVEEPKA